MRLKTRKRQVYLILSIVFLAVLSARLFFAFQTETFTGNTAYFQIRQAENIIETGLPAYSDTLSYSGKTNIFLPLYQYILAGFGMIMPLWAAGKIIPNIFASLLIVVVYLISYELTKNEKASVFSAFVSGFIPIFVNETTNTASKTSLAFPLLFFLVYCFLRCKGWNGETYVHLFLASLFALTLTSTLVIVLVASLLLYLLLLKLENLKQSRVEMEIILFSTFFAVWVMFLVFKKALLTHGAAVLMGNIPPEILANRFADVSIAAALYQVGFIPVMYGLYSVYNLVFRKKARESYILIALAITSAALLWLNLIEVRLGLIILGIVFSIFFSYFVDDGHSYLKKTRFARIENMLLALLLVSFTISSVAPSLYLAHASSKNALTQEEFRALEWIRSSTPEESVIMATADEGNAVSAIAGRKNVADTNFLLQEDAGKRLADLKKMFTTQFSAEAVRLMDEYDVSYVYYSPAAQKAFGIGEIAYVGEGKCFDKVYDDTVRIYKVRCTID